MKRLFLAVALATTIPVILSCSKDKEIVLEDFANNLTGKKFRERVSSGDDAFYCLDFKSKTQVEYSYRTNTGGVINSEYTQLCTYKVIDRLTIEVMYKGIVDKEPLSSKGIVTGDIIGFNTGSLSGYYKKY